MSDSSTLFTVSLCTLYSIKDLKKELRFMVDKINGSSRKRMVWVVAVVAAVFCLLASYFTLTGDTAILLCRFGSLFERSAPNVALNIYTRALDLSVATRGEYSQTSGEIECDLASLLRKRHRIRESRYHFERLASAEFIPYLTKKRLGYVEYSLGRLYFNDHLYDQAAAHFQNSEAFLPQKVEHEDIIKARVLYDQAKALLDTPHPAKAEALLQKAQGILSSAKAPNLEAKEDVSYAQDDISYALARLYKRQGRLSEAANLYTLILSRCQARKDRDLHEMASLNVSLAFLAKNEGNDKQALDYCQQALDLVPNYDRARWCLAMTYDLMGDYNHALSAYGSYFSTQDPLEARSTDEQQIMPYRQICQADYFAAETCQLKACVRTSTPLKVFIRDASTPSGFSKTSREDILQCLEQWCAILPSKLKYVLVDEQETANLIFLRVDSSYDIDDNGETEGLSKSTFGKQLGWGVTEVTAAKIRIVDDLDEAKNAIKRKETRSTVLHEIGHALGIRAHSPYADDVMFPSSVVSEPSKRDVATIKLLYDPAVTTLAEQSLRTLAAGGKPEALVALGEIYERGIDTTKTKNCYVAMEFYKRAIKAGSIDASMKLGDLYETKSDGWKVDYPAALALFKQAAAKNEPQAFVEIGKMYEYGRGVGRSPATAFVQFKKAAQLGSRVGKRKLGICYMHGFGTTKDYFQALKWLEIAAKAGDSYSEYYVGEFYYKGLGVEQDYERARQCYERAANNGSRHGQEMMGFLFETGRGVSRDLSTAKLWYLKAAENNSSYAKKRLVALSGRQ